MVGICRKAMITIMIINIMSITIMIRQSESITLVSGVIGGSVQLPCNITPPSLEDRTQVLRDFFWGIYRDVAHDDDFYEDSVAL